MAGNAIVLQGGGKCVVLKGFQRVFRLPTFVIGMATHTRTFRKRSVKERFAIFCRENLARYVFDADLSWLVAPGALPGGSGKWAVATEAVVFQSLVPHHEVSGVEQNFGKGNEQRCDNGDEERRDSKFFHCVTSSS
jgi:hypothetical protein